MSDDEFADFESAAPINAVTESEANVENVENGENRGTEANQIDSEFTDFASFSDVNETKFVEHIDDSKLDINKLSQLIEDTYNAPDSAAIVEDLVISSDLFLDVDINSINLWKRLQDLDTAPSLKLRWANSHSFQQLLAALKIDPRNILRNSSVPIFASGLGYVLEPTKHSTTNSIEVALSSTGETLSDSPNSLPSIPPVQFDWNSSGLTNPLDVNPKSGDLFDLDFFITNDDVKNMNKQTEIMSLEEELLNYNKPLDNNDQHIPVERVNIVQQLLSSVKSTAISNQGLSERTQSISAEALQVLDELPNLSFMRAKVLMFPINMK